MTDRSPDTHDSQNEAKPDDAFNPSRRKLTGAALGVSAVFTLASRPVWANQCSISGMASGNISAPKVICGGCTPGYWMQCQHLDSWAVAGFNTDDIFNTVFGVTQYINPQNNKPYTLLQVMGLQGSGNCTPDRAQPNCSAKPNGNAIGKMGCDPVSVNLGFHAVAALLNAAHPGVNYGYTPGELTALFRNNLHRAAQLKDSLAMLNERDCPLN
ncbi:MAG: hypothetical protein Q8J70_03605 [Thiobacillus sp.]|nr:hypothetical protein [Thiobacillus sp.]